MFKTQVDDKSIKVGEQAAEDRGKDTRLVTLKKKVPVVNFIACLTNQEHLQHAWDIIFQHSGQLGYHTNTVSSHIHPLNDIYTQPQTKTTSYT